MSFLKGHSLSIETKGLYWFKYPTFPLLRRQVLWIYCSCQRTGQLNNIQNKVHISTVGITWALNERTVIRWVPKYLKSLVCKRLMRSGNDCWIQASLGCLCRCVQQLFMLGMVYWSVDLKSWTATMLSKCTYVTPDVSTLSCSSTNHHTALCIKAAVWSGEFSLFATFLFNNKLMSPCPM